jgi:hypothetical protein
MAFDTMNALLDSICKAGLNRARIHDALANIDEYDGVTGKMVFDPNQKNAATSPVCAFSPPASPSHSHRFPPSNSLVTGYVSPITPGLETILTST